jgi:hypothetical protein
VFPSAYKETSHFNVYVYVINNGMRDRLCGLVVKSSWLQIQRSGFDFRSYQIFWEVVGLERGPLNLVSTTESYVKEKVAAPV